MSPNGGSAVSDFLGDLQCFFFIRFELAELNMFVGRILRFRLAGNQRFLGSGTLSIVDH